LVFERRFSFQLVQEIHRKDQAAGSAIRFPSLDGHQRNNVFAIGAPQVDRGVVLADAAYGMNTGFRDGLTELELQ